MSIANFKPTIWHGMVLGKYRNVERFAGLTNREFEGDIRNYGDTVMINEIGDLTAVEYTGASAITYQNLEGAAKVLKIDQSYMVPVTYPDLDKAQSNPKLMGDIAQEMAYAIQEKVETSLSALYTDAGITVSGTTGSPTSVTSANVTTLFAAANTQFGNNSVPTNGRVCVVPPWLGQKIVLAKIAKDTNNSAVLNEGYIGSYMGWDIYESNNISHSGTTWYAPMFFRRNDTIALAEQIMNVEALRDKDYASDFMRSWILYGTKVVKPKSLGVAYVAEGSET